METQEHLLRRIAQRENLKRWLIDNPDYQIQVNFSVRGTTEHLCVGINAAACQSLADCVMDALDTQITNIKSKIA